MQFEANEKNSLLRLAYSRENCYLALHEDYFDRNLYLIGALGGERGTRATCALTFNTWSGGSRCAMTTSATRAP